LDESASQAKRGVVNKVNEAYKLRQQDYFGTDVKISHKKNNKHYIQEWALDIQNVFNAQNILNQIWNPKTGNHVTNYQIGLFLVSFSRIYF